MTPSHKIPSTAVRARDQRGRRSGARRNSRFASLAIVSGIIHSGAVPRTTPIHTFGKYQITDRIATGGIAEIYQARLEGIGGFQRTFAIKRILPNFSQNAEYVSMLVDEAKVAGLLSHANIVQILDLGQVDGIWYIAMEYVHGRDLGALLRAARDKGLCLPVPHAVFIAIELLKGLEYAHQRQVMRGGRPVALNIVHRDVSPTNILLSYQGEVKLTDFGIARASLKVAETQAGVIKGQFDYMSPEQAGGARDLDQRSDLFTVGVVLYEMLTGQHPFRAASEVDTIDQVRSGTYKPISEINPEVPFTLETIVDRALRVDRDERYPTATAFKEALDKFFHDAGFLFTHNTLAGYVKGLFPDEKRREASEPPIADPPTEIEDLLPDPDGPTGNLSQSDIGSGGSTVGLAPSDFLDDWDEEEDQETVIRARPPELGEGETARRRENTFGPDDPTAIRPAPTSADLDGLVLESLVDEEPLDVHTDAAARGFEPTVDVDLQHSLRIGGTVSDGGRGRTTTGSARRRRGVGYLGWILAACCLILGLMVGFAAGAAVSMLAARGGAEAQGSVLSVRAPSGTAILLDGDAIPQGDTPISPGKHVLEISQRNRETLRREFVVSPGQHREVHVEQLPPTQGDSTGERTD